MSTLGNQTDLNDALKFPFIKSNEGLQIYSSGKNDICWSLDGDEGGCLLNNH